MTAHGAQIGEVNLETPEFGLILWMKAQDLPIQQLADSTTDVVRPVNIPSKPGVGRSWAPWWMRISEKALETPYRMHRQKLANQRGQSAKVEGQNSTFGTWNIWRWYAFASSTEWLSDCCHKSWCERCGKGCQKLALIWICWLEPMSRWAVIKNPWFLQGYVRGLYYPYIYMCIYI